MALICATVAGFAAPLAAQVARGNGIAPVGSPPTGDSIGPRELRNFSLGGTPQPAAPTPAPTRRNEPAPVATDSAPPPAPARDKRAAPKPAAPAEQAAPARPASGPSSVGITVPLPAPAPIAGPGEPPGEVPQLSSPVAIGTAARSAPEGGSSWSLVPWLIALLVLGGAALAYAFRGGFARRTEPALADGFLLDAAPAPVPAYPPAAALARAPSPAAALPAAPVRPLGIVSSKLRPWVDISFEPTRAVVDERSASVQFDVVVTNSGSAPARQVVVEATMINAGSDQDAELGRFFDAPVGAGDRIEVIPPLGSVSLKSTVSLPLDQVRAYEVGGRRLFVPVVAFNALYEWSSGTGQSSASFICGRGGGGGEGEGDPNARMAPLRLDLGPRLFRDLDARRHPLGRRV